jgi:2-polyprenyl-6-methoxyphenol hydroxylase-like FAD-dependent oxidoreductase
MTTDDPVDVAVVGLGPVGGVLATLLGRRGHRVAVLERHRKAYLLPRAVHFDHEVARILQSCGLGEDLPVISAHGSEYEWRNGSGQVLLRFGGRAVGPSGWPDSNMFWQPALEALIEQAAAGQPNVELRRGSDVVALEARGEEVVVLTVEPVDGPQEQLRARYVVGCDGANSTVRDLIGGTVTDLGFFYDWLIVDVALHEPRVFDPVNLQICDPARPTTVVSGGPGRRRWEFMRLPDETTDELDEPARAWQLLEPWDVTPANATLERHAVYRFQARWADKWRRGNVLLAGDAAHQMPPFAGQGMCSGLRDAANLAWKLDLVLAGRAPSTLLDAYQTERNDNVRAVIDFSMDLGKVICITDPEEAAARDVAMASQDTSSAHAPPPLPGVTGGIIRAGDPVAGELFVQGRVRQGATNALLDDLVGAGWRLITMSADLGAALSPTLGEWFADCGGAVVVVERDDDVDGTYSAWFDTHDLFAVLQRPDFSLFGSAADDGQVEGLVSDLRAALAAGAA